MATPSAARTADAADQIVFNDGTTLYNDSIINVGTFANTLTADKVVANLHCELHLQFMSFGGSADGQQLIFATTNDSTFSTWRYVMQIPYDRNGIVGLPLGAHVIPVYNYTSNEAFQWLRLLPTDPGQITVRAALVKRY